MSFLLKGDCLEEMKKIERNYVDMVLVDLPYGQTSCDWDVKIDLVAMWKELERICKSNCNYIFFTTTKFGVELINSRPSWFRYDLVWEKSVAVGHLSANKMPMRSHEMIYVFGKPSAKGKIYNPQKTPGNPYKKKAHINNTKDVYGQIGQPELENKSGDRHPRSVQKFSQDCVFKKTFHRTQKPINICEWLIKTYSNEGDVVMDFTMGSGSTIISSINTNRKYIGIEMNDEIFDIAMKRINI
jgi:site-specific DNA-methyltransferase (adenine-specific)